MRRWAKRASLLALGVLVGLGGKGTVAAFTDSTANPPSVIGAVADWVAPEVQDVVVVKERGGTPGFVTPVANATIPAQNRYRVCARIGADSGNPASGLKDVTANLSALTTSLTGTVLGALGAGSPCPAGYAYDSGAQTLSTGVAAGPTSVTLTTSDNASNTATGTGAVTVDATAPRASAIATTNAGGQLSTSPGRGTPGAGDTVTFTFDEPVEPESVVPGWTGAASTAVSVNFVNAGNNKNPADTIQIRRGTGGLTVVPLTPSPVAVGARNYVTGTVLWPATMTRNAAGDAFTITLGTHTTTAAVQSLVSAAFTWVPGTALYDRAGNPAATAAATDAAGVDF